MNQPNVGAGVKAYHKANHTVSKTRQVVMLYDGAIRFLQQAMDAIERRDYETRYNKLTRVSDILIGLQSCLDFEAGGDTARMLYDFYSSLDLRIFSIHRTNDLEACRKLMAELKEMRDSWDVVDRNVAAPVVPPANPAGGTSGEAMHVSA